MFNEGKYLPLTMKSVLTTRVTYRRAVLFDFKSLLPYAHFVYEQ